MSDPGDDSDGNPQSPLELVMASVTGDLTSPRPLTPRGDPTKFFSEKVQILRMVHNLERCGDPECLICGILECPHHEPLHFHHDGCPACTGDKPCESCGAVEEDLVRGLKPGCEKCNPKKDA